MTKARDIASASPAPSTVSATELGYLDGVSSAIQTQIDSKIGSASAINPTIVDAKGDLLVGSAADTVARLAVGTNNHVLTADSAATNGVKWAAAGGGGKVLQVVSATTDTQVTITSDTTYADTGMSATITPTASNSKILILAMGATSVFRGTSNTIFGFNMKLLRGATTLFENVNQGIEMATVSDKGMKFYIHYSYLDSPATTSSTTYKIQSKSAYPDSSVYWQDSSGGVSRLSSIILMEIGA